MEKSNFSFDKRVESLGLNKSDKVLIAYSGGGDSTFLLMQALNYFYDGNLYVAYVDYHDSEYTPEEEKIVLDFIRDKNIQFFRKDVYLSWKESNFEARARDIRYKFFKDIVLKENLKGVLVAHHANDDAETYLFQKSRGSITDELGLKSISILYGISVYRPLLPIKKSDIIKYLNDNDIIYFDDPTNKNWNRSRDRLRMSVLSSDDNVDKTLEQRNRDSIKNDEEIEKANEFLNKNRYEFKEYRKLSINIQRRFLYKAIQILIGKEDNDMVVSTMNICFEFLKSNRTESLKLNDELYLYKDKDEFYFGSPIELNDSYSFEIDRPGIYDFNSIHLDLSNPSLYKINKFPVFIKAVKKGDMISTDLECKDGWLCMKKHGVPTYLRGFYPALYNKEGNIIYLPFYGDDKFYINVSRIYPKQKY